MGILVVDCSLLDLGLALPALLAREMEAAFLLGKKTEVVETRPVRPQVKAVVSHLEEMVEGLALDLRSPGPRRRKKR